jgi:Flp pilus assembly protein TadD
VLAIVLVAIAGAAPVGSQVTAPADGTVTELTAHIERGDFDAAGRSVEAALKRRPEDPVLHNFAGVIAAERGRFAPAESHFREAIRLAPRSPAAYENLGRLYQERAADAKMRARAIAVYRQLLEVAPDSAEGLFQTAFLLALDGRFAESRAALDRLSPDVARRPQALAILAIDLDLTGDASGARRTADALAAHPDLTEPDVMAAVAVAPAGKGDAIAALMLDALDRRGLATPRALESLAAMHVRGERFAEARRYLERVAAAAGPSAPLLIKLARTAIKTKDFEGALGYLAHARSLEPANATVHFLFGMVCVEQNLGSEAYESMKKAVALDPENPLVNYAMGAIATHRHEPSESVPYFEKYVKLAPDDPRGHFALGAALFHSNLFDAARPVLERAARNPATATGGHYYLGRLARQANDLVTARREIEAALRLDDDLADAWAELGLLQTRAGEHAAAEQSLAKALALDPDHYAATVNLATLYARTKDPRRAAQVARIAALAEKRDARAQEFLRMIQVVPYEP